MNTVEAAESCTASAKAPGMIEEEIQKKIDEILAVLVMIDKLEKVFSAGLDINFADLGKSPERLEALRRYKVYHNARLIIEEVREIKVEELRHWQQDRDALKRQIGEEAGNTGNTGNTMSTGLEAGE